MMKYLIVFVTISILFTACRQEEKLPDAPINISVAIDQLQKNYPFAQKFHYSGMVPLETTEQSRLGDIQRVFLVDSLFIVWDSKKVVAFDSEGSYVSCIGHQGRASNEYMRISDVNVDYDKKSIYLLDNSSQKILEYSVRGDFKRRISIKNWANGFLSSGDNLWLENHALDGQDKMLLCTDANTNKIKRGYFPFFQGGTMPIRREKSFCWDRDTALFASSYINTIYKIKSEEISPYAAIKFMDNKTDGNADMTLPDFFLRIEEKDYVGHLHDVFFVKPYLFFSFYQNAANDVKIQYSVCYNTATNETDVYDFSLLHDSRIPVSPTNDIKGTYKNGMIFYLDVSGLPDFLMKKLQETEGMESIDDKSNPILILYDVD